MVVVSAPAVYKICESFMHNPPMQARGNPTFQSLTKIHKECIDNTRDFESDFGGGKHGCECFDIGEQQCILHSNITFAPPRKPGLSPAYLLNPTHRKISVAEQHYQNNVYEYHLVKNMNNSFKKIIVAAINKQWIKGAKDMVMGYANKSFVELMDWLYVRYDQIMPGYLMQNQENMKATYDVKDPIHILFDQIEMGYKFAVAGNPPFSDR